MIGLRVLFVEDCEDDVILAEHALDAAAIRATTRIVHDELELCRALADWKPDVIISDFRLPRFDGVRAFELAQRVAPSVPFIFYTGRAPDPRMATEVERGVCRWVSKDCRDELIACVLSAVNVYH